MAPHQHNAVRDRGDFPLWGNPRFELRRKLGEGGFGAVFEVVDKTRSATVALKVLRRVEAEDLYRFKQEFRGLADIRHQNLVQLYELSGDGDRWFFTMELVEGSDALAFVRQRSRVDTDTPTIKPGDSPADAAPVSVRAAGSPEPGKCPGFDEGRLRSVLLQLAEGLSALHDAGKMHRDVKPSNVLVTREGRLVLVDFGLVARLSSSGEMSRANVVGTPEYLPPEILYGHPATAASDWYAVGVLLYEGLTGRLPFSGKLQDVLRQKLEHDPPRPSTLCPGVPPDLDRLCMALLRRRPEERPTQAEILDRVGSAAGPRSGPQKAPFVGRDAACAALLALARGVPAGGAAVALVDGPSGIGRSAFLHRACHEIQRVMPNALVLRGRCYEQETMPYNAIDGLVDPLSRALVQLPAEALAGVLPADVRAAARLFPVLEQVPAIAKTAVRPIAAHDAGELRRRGCIALRELLARLARLRPLVLALDDLQWGDHDSGVLLAEILAPPDPPPLLLVAAHLAGEAGTSPCLRAVLPALASMRGPALRVDTVALGPLSEAEVHAMARALLREEGDDAAARAVAREAGGNPHFVRELCLRAPGAAAPSLDALVRARLAELPEGAQRLLEVIALAGRPVDRSTALRAAALDDEGAAAYDVLRTARLARRRDGDEVEPYHDRIREAVVGGLSAAARADGLRRLALALDEAVPASGRRADEGAVAAGGQVHS